MRPQNLNCATNGWLPVCRCSRRRGIITMMNTRFGMKVLAAPLVLGFALACSDGDSTVVLTLAHSATRTSLIGRTAEEFARRANEQLVGRARVDVFESSLLGSDEIVLQKLKLGTVDLALNSTVMSSVVDEFALFEMPYLVRDRQHMQAIGEQIFWPFIGAPSEAAGYRVLALWENGFRHITNDVRPIETPLDLRGLKLRTPTSPWRMRLFESFGANPSPLPFQDLFLALQTGMMDGQENPLSNIVGGSLQEVQTYLTLTGHLYSPAFLVVSSAKFAQLPNDVQRILEETARATQAFALFEGARADSVLLQRLRESGMQINEANRESFARASIPIYDAFGEFVDGGRQLIDSVLALADGR